MILSKFEMFLLMNLFKKWMLGLDNRSKIVFLESSYDCQCRDREKNVIVDVVGGLDSIIKFSRRDLTAN